MQAPKVGQKRRASGGSDSLRMLFQGHKMSDVKMEEMRNSGEYRRWVSNFRGSDEMAELLVGASDVQKFREMRLSGRYDEPLVKLVKPLVKLVKPLVKLVKN